MSKRYKPVDGFDTVEGLILGEDGICFVDDPTTCIKRRKSDGDVVTTVAGTDILEVGSGDVESKVVMRLPAGSDANCSLQSEADAAQGMYFPDTSTVVVQSSSDCDIQLVTGPPGSNSITLTNPTVSLTVDETDVTVAGGELAVPNGTAAAPAIHGTAADDGFYFATDEVSIANSGAAALRVHDDGVVTAPSQAYLEVRGTTTQSIPNNMGTNVTLWSAADEIRNISFDDSTGVITIEHAGVYAVHCTLPWANNATGTRYGWFVLNGSSSVRHGYVTIDPITSGTMHLNLNLVREFDVDDTLVLVALQDSGGNLNAGSTSASHRTRLGVTKIS